MRLCGSITPDSSVLLATRRLNQPPSLLLLLLVRACLVFPPDGWFLRDHLHTYQGSPCSFFNHLPPSRCSITNDRESTTQPPASCCCLLYAAARPFSPLSQAPAFRENVLYRRSPNCSPNISPWNFLPRQISLMNISPLRYFFCYALLPDWT